MTPEEFEERIKNLVEPSAATLEQAEKYYRELVTNAGPLEAKRLVAHAAEIVKAITAEQTEPADVTAERLTKMQQEYERHRARYSVTPYDGCVIIHLEKATDEERNEIASRIAAWLSDNYPNLDE